MKNRILALFLLILGCAGGTDIDPADLVFLPADAGAELGSADQALIYQPGAVYGIGHQTSAAHKQCDKTTSGQVCLVPRSAQKILQWKFNSSNPFSTNEKVQMANTMQSIDGASNWIFQQLQPGEAFNPAAVWVTLTDFTCSGTLGTAIEGYSCPSFEGVSDMIEGPGIPMQYQNFSSVTGRIDIIDIRNRAAGDAVKELRLVTQAVAHIGLSAIGLGSRDDVASNFYSARAINLNPGVSTVFTQNEQCRVNNFTIEATDQTHIDLNGATCSGATE